MISVNRFDGTSDECNRFATVQSGYSRYHRLECRSLIADVFGHECLYLSAREGEELIGVLPLVRIRSIVFGSADR